MQDVVFTASMRGREVDIVRDTCADHPADMTDEPVHYGTWAPGYSIAPRGQDEGKPFEWKGRTIVYIHVDSYGASLSNKEEGNAAVWLDLDEEKKYGGGNPTMRRLRAWAEAYAQEVVAYCNGDVYGYRLYKTFQKNNKTYRVDSSENSCWGFYGAIGLYDIGSNLPVKLRAAVHRFARKEGYKGR